MREPANQTAQYHYFSICIEKKGKVYTKSLVFNQSYQSLAS